MTLHGRDQQRPADFGNAASAYYAGTVAGLRLRHSIRRRKTCPAARSQRRLATATRDAERAQWGHVVLHG